MVCASYYELVLNFVSYCPNVMNYMTAYRTPMNNHFNWICAIYIIAKERIKLLDVCFYGWHL